MYVCICNAYTDREILAMAEAGVRCVEEAYHRLGSGPICRRCLTTAQQIIENGRRARAPGGTYLSAKAK